MVYCEDLMLVLFPYFWFAFIIFRSSVWGCEREQSDWDAWLVIWLSAIFLERGCHTTPSLGSLAAEFSPCGMFINCVLDELIYSLLFAVAESRGCVQLAHDRVSLKEFSACSSSTTFNHVQPQNNSKPASSIPHISTENNWTLYCTVSKWPNYSPRFSFPFYSPSLMRPQVASWAKVTAMHLLSTFMRPSKSALLLISSLL